MALVLDGDNGIIGVLATNADGDVIIDTNTFFVDAPNNRVGIGTLTPQDKLHIVDGDLGIENTSGRRYRIIAETSGNLTIRDQTAAQGRLTINTSGNIGIGTSAPSTKLVVAGSDSTTHSTTGDTRYTNARLTVQNTDNTLFSVAGITLSSGSSVGGNWQMDSIRQNNYLADLAFKTRTGSSSYKEQMRINSSGHVTAPSQPGFAAVRNSTYNYSGGSGYTTISSWYNSTTRQSFNTGSHFNHSTGVFTAPVSGKYTFKFQILLQSVASGDDSIHVAFYTNGAITQYGNIRAPGASASYVGYGAYLPVIGSTDVYLNANDTVELRMSSSGNIDVYGGSDWSRFSGYLIG